MNPRHILIDGRPYAWSELVKLRREQLAAQKTHAHQCPALFELKDDVRPSTERKAADILYRTIQTTGSAPP
jgi:hypothetical protein